MTRTLSLNRLGLPAELARVTAVVIPPGIVDPAASTVESSAATTPAGTAVTITVTVVDTASGAPVVGATVVLAASGTGNTLTQPGAVTDVNGVATGTFASSVAEAKTISATADGVAITDTAGVTVEAVGGGVTPVLEEDFSTYADTADMLADPRGIWATGEASNTARIALDTTVGYGASDRSMRYDWPNNGVVCSDYGIKPGQMEIPGSLTHVWLEYVVRFSANFAVNAGSGSCAAEYKLAAASDPGAIGRWNIPEMQAGQWVTGYPNTVAGVGGAPTPSDLWDGLPHVFRVEMRVSPSGNTGILKFWVDGTLKDNLSGFNTAGGSTVIRWFAPGLNLNQGPAIDNMHLWWHRIRVYNTDPGWT